MKQTARLLAQQPIQQKRGMLRNDISLVPFMGCSKTISVGLNPLGIRTASEQLFTTLLPGLNVVTQRIRYYSFYCWLLKTFYAQRAQANLAEIRRYIRMSELLMALIHAQSQNGGGVPGITRAYEVVARDAETIDFNEDAMPGGKPSGGYWKGTSGAFGTYYVASLQEMRIIRPLVDNTSLYNVTPKSPDYIAGEELADAFAETIGKEMSNLFQACAKKGSVTREQLVQMEPYFQTHNLPDNKESQLLLRMLLQNDYPSSSWTSELRKNSIRLLLSYFNEKEVADFSELDFAKYVYTRYSNGTEASTAAAGWYAYYLNDSRQYEALNIFDVVLRRLKESTKPGKWEYINDYTTELAEEVCSEFDAKDKSIKDLLEEWDLIDPPAAPLSHAFYVILDDYYRNPNYMECKSIVRESFRSVSNDAMDAFDNLEKHLDVSMQSYVKTYLTEDIIYKHYSESMRKFCQNGIPTQKLTIENGLVRGLATYNPTHSSPRIDTVRNFMTDLGLVQGYKVTAKGVELLIQLEND